MATNKFILTYADTLEKVKFFNRFYPAIQEIGYEIIVLTNRISALMFNYNPTIKIVKKENVSRYPYVDILFQARELKDNSLTQEETATLFWSVYKEVLRVLDKFQVDCFFIFGGLSAPELALRRIAKEYNIKTLFFELSNIPGKIFVDPSGTNAESSLYNDISRLDVYTYSAEEYQTWKDHYLRKKEQIKIPQQALKRRQMNTFYLIDHVGFLLFCIPSEDNRPFLRKLRRKLYWRKKILSYDEFDVKKGGYIFFPMQVSNDTQLLFHSNVGNFEAIEYSISLAQKERKALLVKPHPAETEPAEIMKLAEFKKKYEMFIVNLPSLEILKYSDRVITINSTVGLEALIVGKKVEFLGRTFYKYLTEERLKKYIMSYLIDFDYFSDSKIPLSSVKQCIMRLETNY